MGLEGGELEWWIKKFEFTQQAMGSHGRFLRDEQNEFSNVSRRFIVAKCEMD